MLFRSYPEEAAPQRFLFFPDLGVKIGFERTGDERWRFDHIEYLAPGWSVEDLSSFKYGGALVELDVVTAAERR